jgi:hypothetical protein
MELRMDRLVGRMVIGANHRRVGRIEEIRVERHGDECVVASYALGSGGLLERLGAGTRLLVGGRRASGYIVRWDQLDVSDVEHPRLRCPVRELARE